MAEFQIDISLQTQEHPDHNEMWLVSNANTEESMCVACLLELLDNEDTLVIRKKVVLVQLLKILSYPKESLQSLFAWDIRVHSHIALIILETAMIEDETVTPLACECLLQLFETIATEDLVTSVMDAISQECLKYCNFKRSLPLLSLLGRMLIIIPGLAQQIFQNYGSLMDFISSGLTYSDATVQGAVSYVCIQMLASPSHQLPHSLCIRLSAGVLQAFYSANGTALQMNLIGLLRVLTKYEDVCLALMSPPKGTPSLSAVAKRALLSREPVLQISMAQCLLCILNHRQAESFVKDFLEADIAEFVFEVINSTNEVLVASLYCLLLRLTESKFFFKKSHGVYGIESVVRSIEHAFELNNPDIIQYGLQVLNNILKRHEGCIRLFNGRDLMVKCIKIIRDGIKHINLAVQSVACQTLISLLRPEHQTNTPPVEDIQALIGDFVGRVYQRSNTERKTCPRIRDRRTRASRRKGKCSLQEDIASLLQALNVLCKWEASSERDLGAKNPKDESSENASFRDWLSGILSSKIIPMIMQKWDICDTLEVIVSFYTLLVFYLEGNLREARCIAEALVAAEFIARSLNARAKFGHTELSNLISTSLAFISVVLLPPELRDAQNYLKSGISSFKVGANFMDHLLDYEVSGNVLTDGDSTQLQIHRACLVLVYIVVEFSNLNTDFSNVCSVLHVFVNNLDNLGSLPSDSRKILIYLLAKLQKPSSDTPNTKLLESLQDLPVESWCSINPLTLDWCLNIPRILETCGNQLVEYYLQTEKQSYEGAELLAGRIGTNPLLAQKILASMTGENTATLMRVSILLKQFFTYSDQNSEDHNFHESAITSATLQAIQKVFMCGVDNQSAALLPILDLLAVIIVRDDMTISTVDLKVISYVSAYCVADGCPDDIAQQASAILSSYLIKALQLEDNRVISVLISENRLIEFLRQLYSKGHRVVDACYIKILALVIISCSKFELQIEATSRISLNTTQVLDVCPRPGNIDHSTLLLWAAVFLELTHNVMSRFNTGGGDRQGGQVLIIFPDKSISSFADHQISDGYPWTDRKLRLIYVILQNSLLSEVPDKQQISVFCLENLFAYLEKHERNNLLNHFLHQPWNDVIMDIMLGGDSIPVWFIHFLSLLFRYKSDVMSFQTQEEVIKHFLKETDAATIHQYPTLITQILDMNRGVESKDLTDADAKLRELSAAGCKNADPHRYLWLSPRLAAI